MNSEAILKDKISRYESKIIFYENVISPLGSNNSKESINKLVTLINLIKKSGGHISVSRTSARAWEWLISNLKWVILFGLILLAVYYGLNPA
jgi:hypothetical protein